tara:strand:- start:321 stop:572 length:252 start_codon:yes stop_codon:yes gene_type:complete
MVDGDIVRVYPTIDGSTQVRLVETQAPNLPPTSPHFAKWALADDTKAQPEEVFVKKNVTIALGGPRMDRHGRWLAHLHDHKGR